MRSPRSSALIYWYDPTDGVYSMDNDAENYMPHPPVFTNELIEQCKRDLDFRPILFEWYKFVGEYCSVTACLTADSPAFRSIPPLHFAVLTGLLNRCSRLMLANVRLSSSRKYGETTQLLDRSIEETAVKILWLCHKDDDDRFQQYLADGLKNDLRLKRSIEENIGNRGGDALVIESRMLHSIQECINLSELSEQEVNDSRPFPNLAAMFHSLGLDDFSYTAIQRMGSHAVHGTWSDLVHNYLSHDAAQGFRPRGRDVETEDVQFMVVSQLVLEAISCFAKTMIEDPSDTEGFLLIQKGIESKFSEIRDLAWASDFDTE